MLEFLQKCDQYNIFNRARDCEIKINSFDSISPMAIFFETILKLIYHEQYPNLNVQAIEEMKFIDLLRNGTFIKKVSTKYAIDEADWELINFIIRKKSNQYKHSLNPEPVNKETVKKCFQCVYNFSTQFYRVKTKAKGENVPVWDDAQYDELLKNAVDDGARKERESELNQQISLLNQQLKDEKAENSESRKEVDRLREELEKAKFSNADPKELHNLRHHINELQAKIDNEQAQKLILERKAKSATENQKKAELELQQIQIALQQASKSSAKKLQAAQSEMQKRYDTACKTVASFRRENEVLLSRIKEISDERDTYQKQLNAVGESSADRDVVQQLESDLAIAERRRSSSEKRLRDMEDRLTEMQGQLFTAKTALDKVNRQYLDSRREATALNEKRAVLMAENEELQRQIEASQGPRCPKCNSQLVVKKNSSSQEFFWGCPSYKKDGSGCKFTRPIQASEQDVARRLFNLNQTKWDNFNEVKQLKTAMSRLTRPNRFALDRSRLERYKAKSVEFSLYPYSFENSIPTAYLFQSISVPPEIFRDRENLGVKFFSQFEMCSAMERQPVGRTERTIYSLALRMLNRGIVLPAHEKVSEILAEKFNQRETGHINSLFDYISYSSPENPYNSDRERKFAEYYFPKLLGESWATYVFSQIGFDALIPDSENYTDQRVDFLLNKNGQKIIIELDGAEHSHTAEHDSMRDADLRSAGYQVLRFSNAEVDAFDEAIMDRLKSAIGDSKAVAKDTLVDDRYLVACKLAHQFSIAVVKSLEQGYISNVANLHASVDSELFTDAETQFILTLAVTEVQDILQNFGRLYGVDVDWDLLNSSVLSTKICVGDGMYMDHQSIMLRDCYLQYNYLCSIAPFDAEVIPTNCDIEALTFFLRYIFGHENFRDGQYQAIRRFMERKDSIILLPTGAGKSIIYQLASFLVPGMTIVISPLISLIEDQINNLDLKCGINNAHSIVSAVTEADKLRKEEALRLMKHNATCMLYIAPERLQIPQFRNNAMAMMRNNNVFAVAIDEAHCVSEWGHDFRPAYLNIGNSARNLFKKNDRFPVLIALTGTASEAVLSDIQRDLNIVGRNATITPPTFDRPELKFSVEQCDSQDKALMIANLIKNKLPKRFNRTYDSFIKLDDKNTNAGIVFTPYATSKNPGQYDAASLHQKLTDMLPEVSIASYFSKVPDGYDDITWKTTIRENARRFKKDELNLLVATKAFGMGIDKENIRYVVHDGIPTSFEQYYQEAGRAGRDRKNAECVLLFSDDNATLNAEMLNPALELKDLTEKYSEYQEKVQAGQADDLTAALFFHINSYRGVEEECKSVNRIIDLICDIGFLSGREVQLTMPIEPGENKGTVEKNWLQAMVRLVVLGVVKDYTYDYRNQFVIFLDSMEKNYVIEKYVQYVSSYSVGRIGSEREKLSNIDADGKEFIKVAVRVLIEYIYDNIEQSRRRAVREMYMTAREAITKKGEEQNLFFRERILNYFSYKGKSSDSIQDMVSAPNAGLGQLATIFDFSPDKVRYDDDEIQDARKIGVVAGRMLESKPDHPGLILLQTCAKVISAEYEKMIVVHDLTAAIQYAKTRYSVTDSVLWPVVWQVLNLMLNTSADLFDLALIQISETQHYAQVKLLDHLLTADEVSDDNREYILMQYTLERTKRITG